MNRSIYKTEYQPKKSKWSIVENLLLVFVLMIFIKVVLFNFMYISAKVHGESMQPNLNPVLAGQTKREEKEKDIVFVHKYSKFTYGDIIVIKGSIPLIKRVIALGGDVISYKLEYNEELVEEVYMFYLNDEKLNEDYNIYPLTASNIKNATDGPFGELFKNPIHKDNCDINNEGVAYAYRVPAGSVFVMGDNRPNSSDSRTLGAFTYDNIEGKVVRIIPYGTNKFSYFLNVLFI